MKKTFSILLFSILLLTSCTHTLYNTPKIFPVANFESLTITFGEDQVEITNSTILTQVYDKFKNYEAVKVFESIEQNYENNGEEIAYILSKTPKANYGFYIIKVTEIGQSDKYLFRKTLKNTSTNITETLYKVIDLDDVEYFKELLDN
ncbi:MAG: hypothetical protein PHT83_02890 [Bacilli bacterium]|nr:hypothetical protein [Bacilli bacterium]